MPKSGISTLHMRGRIVFQSRDGLQAAGGLQEINSPDVSLRIFLMEDALKNRPYLRLCANFATRRSEEEEEEDGKHDVYFDFHLDSIQEFRLLEPEPLPESLLRDCTFSRRTSLQRLKVKYNGIHITGLQEALRAADNQQSAALSVLAKNFPFSDSFTFYTRRKQAFSSLVRNMDRALTNFTQ